MTLGKPIPERFASTTPLALLAVAFLALILHAFYGFDTSSESLTLSLVDRLFRGATPVLDEWHPSQFEAILLLPLYSAYQHITGSSNGVVIFFRLVYVLISFVIALVSYKTLQGRFGRFNAICAAFIYLFFVGSGVSGMSPYALCTSFILLSLLCGWRLFETSNYASSEQKQSVQSSSSDVLVALIAGVFFGFAVICNPCVIVIYIIAVLVAVLWAHSIRRPLSLVPFSWTLAGMLVVGLVYLMYLFSRVSPGIIVANVNNVFLLINSIGGAGERLPSYLSKLLVSHVGFVGTWLLVIFLIIWRASEHGITTLFRVTVFFIDLAFLILSCVHVFLFADSPRQMLVAFVEFALPCYLLQTDLRLVRHPEIFAFWIPGVLLSLAWQFVGDVQIEGIIGGVAIASIGALPTVMNAVPLTIGKNYQQSIAPIAPASTWLHVLATVLIACVVVVCVCVRLGSFPDAMAYKDTTTTIGSGPAQGIIASSRNVTDYIGIEELVDHISNDASVCIGPGASWAYLECEGTCAAPSTSDVAISSRFDQIYYGSTGHARPRWYVIIDSDVQAAHDNVRADAISLQKWLDANDEYAPIYRSAYGTIYKHADKAASMTQGS